MSNETIRAPGRIVTVGDACRKLNPHLFRKLDPEAMEILNSTPIKKPKKKRIRQRSSDGLNKNEREALNHLRTLYPAWEFRIHPMKLELANGCWYTPDFGALARQELIIYEVKGKHAWDDAIVKLKVVARVWPCLTVALLWKEEGRWMEQAILP